jgi:DNA-binding GntR family transcriptional regulator
MTDPVPRKTTTLADLLFERLCEAVVEGQLPAGTKISEPELARTYRVSRGPLREAISRLEACGLVTRRANVGARVVSLSARELIEIFRVREALEGMAARLAAENMTDTEVSSMRELLERHRTEVAEDEGRAYFQKQGDLDFHYRIVQASRNSRLVSLLCDDLYHLVRMYRYQFGMPSKRGPVALNEHAQIVEAMADRDGELAELLMRRHIRASRRNVERMLEQG